MIDFRAPAIAGFVLALAACAELPGGGGAPATDGEAAVADEDACGASGMQNLVGASVGTLDPATLPSPHRVIFPGQPVTMDFRADRLNVEIGADDKVARVYCG